LKNMIKRITAFCTALLLVCSVGDVTSLKIIDDRNTVSAESLLENDKFTYLDENGIEWSLTVLNSIDMTVSIAPVYKSKLSGAVEIPGTVYINESDATYQYKVTTITGNAFSDCSSLTDLILPDTITEIGAYAFGNTGLIKFTVPAELTIINSDAFSGCTSLETVNFNDKISSINMRAFKDCSSLKFIVFPKSLTEIKKSAFENCNNLSYIYYLGNSWNNVTVSAIGNNALNDIKSVIYHEAVQSTCTVKGNISYYEISGEDTYYTALPATTETQIGKNDIQTALKPHNFSEYISDNNATCIQDGTMTAKCDNCDETDTKTEVGSAKGHKAVSANNEIPATCLTDGKSSDTVCENCGDILSQGEKIPAMGHSFTNYVSDNNATCTQDGTMTAKCDNCDETDTKTEVGSAKGHKAVSANNEIPATCLTDGKSSDTVCENCGDTLSQGEKISATGHSFTNYVLDNNATCTQDGTMTAKCDNCDETDTKTEVGSAKGHKAVSANNEIPATCLNDGKSSDTVCENCGDTLSQGEKIPATGHSFTNYVSDNNATCTQDGTMTAKCDNCNETATKTEVGSAKGHREISANNGIEPTCTSSGKKADIICSVCNETISEGEEIPQTGHDYSGGKCTFCGKYEDNIGGNPYGHSILLNGDIGLKFYMELSDETAADESAEMVFTFSDGTVTTQPICDAVKSEGKGHNCYAFFCEVPAKDMTSEIRAQIISSVGESSVYTFSVQQYAREIIDDPENYGDFITVTKAMLNYGAAAQVLFGINTDNPANSILSDNDKILSEPSDLDNYKFNITGEQSGISYYGASLLLNSKTDIRFYFTVNDESVLSQIDFTVDGVPVTPIKKNGYYCVEVKNIAPQNNGISHTVTAGDLRIENYSVLSFINSANSWSGSEPEFKAVMYALYEYGKRAEQIFS